MLTQTNQTANALNYSGVIEDFKGKSTDQKPTLKRENNSSTFFEMDTGDVYMWDGDNLSWILI